MRLVAFVVSPHENDAHHKQDHVCSPLVESLKAAAGAEYEGVLEARLSAAGVPFATEADLRAGGFARTPVRSRH